MDDFVWQKGYSIGEAAIDQEHQHLLELANEVVRFRSSGERLERVREALVALYDYVKTHFAHEEEYMAQVRYPGLPAHRVLHEAIIHEMNVMMRESPQLDTLVYKLKRLMKSWVLDHIQQADRQIGDFLRQRAAGTAPASEEQPPPAA